ncbi:MAG: ABC transporter substrate-binding protein [Treponema sp.]|nr:ABC transporter substrate-binding protein [Treponema sp.]
MRKHNAGTRSIFFLAFVFLFIGLSWAGGKQDSVQQSSISFAGSGGYPPFNFITDSGDVAGFDVDVGKELAKRLGKKLDYKTTAWDGIIEGLRAGRYDGILGSMAVTPERAEVVAFSDPYYYSGPQLIVRKNSGINGPEDLDSTSKVGVATGTTYEKDCNILGVQVRLYEDDNQTLMELINGRIDGVLTDRIVGLNAISKMQGGDKLELAGSVLRTEKMAIAFNKKDTKLLEKVNGILSAMRDDGTLQKISVKWFNGADITVE